MAEKAVSESYLWKQHVWALQNNRTGTCRSQKHALADPRHVCLKSLRNHFIPTTRSNSKNTTITNVLICQIKPPTAWIYGDVTVKSENVSLPAFDGLYFSSLLSSDGSSGPWRSTYHTHWRWRVAQGLIFCLFTWTLSCFLSDNTAVLIV